jgi:hypothetical protein
MKACLITTGVLFGLLTLVHIWRLFAESPHLFAESPHLADPWFILIITLVAAGLGLWAWRLLRRAA